MDVDAGNVTLFEAQGRPGNGSVDGHASSSFSCDVDLLLSNGEVIFHSCCLSLEMGKEGKEDQDRNCRGLYAVSCS